VSGVCFANPACAVPSDTQQACAHAAQVRVVCSSGGHFARQASGNLEYEGGETRLVSVANFCSLADLQARARCLLRLGYVRGQGGKRSC